MLKYNTILFDLDGTIVDTNELILHTFEYVLERHFPGQYRREHIIPYFGETLFTMMERFGGVDLRDQLVREYREYNEQVHDEWVKSFPHVYETIEELHRLGATMGIVTTKQRKTAMMGAKLFGLDQFMSTFISFDDVTKHKPDPEPVLKAMAEIKADPSSTIMVGDSSADILAAHNAGIASVAVSWSLKGAQFLRTLNPHYVIEDIRELLDIVKGAR